ncbi:MAG TPA: bifunctional 4-hydroxy-2-oxoglutarate aldolase/2-dehydro-3-deoxy-phosphogluconate aldolase [Caulobacteraceae bacterium]|jgi:2-dehydro-3-deoxyphosphogluconate aldolase/(4S)-4-hydroxy-2-oxoglutarate aldolase|nr:bifunctional 4-hydroxy-2-oxoglutarate aldolase/2-dehydro-3-deoxy-phosphogluconate aldolase [Caulobacteraceae bacterium]
MTVMSSAVDALMRRSPLIPVVVIKYWRQAAPMAKALFAGGVPVVEITLRTDQALEAIRAASAEAGDALVGAGTLLSPKDIEAAKAAGAKFGVSPGLTPTLLQAAKDMDLPLLPGVATASEIVTGLEHGYDRFKLFPAVPVGGIELLKAFAGPFGGVKFCPTGGVARDTAAAFLALDNVLCVGGSWLAPQAAMDAGDWGAIETIARESVTALKAG